MKLFMSYSHDDKHYVYELANRLRNQFRHEVWLDQELSGGELWWSTILDEIEACDCFIVVLTPLYTASNFCNTELTYALALNKVILPLLLKNCSSLPAGLRKIQYIDLRSLLSFEENLFRCIHALTQIEASRHSRGYQAQVSIARPLMPDIETISQEIGKPLLHKPAKGQATERDTAAPPQQENARQIFVTPLVEQQTKVIQPEQVQQKVVTQRISSIDEKQMQFVPAITVRDEHSGTQELVAFYIDAWPVTNIEYWRFLQQNNISPPPSWRRGSFPPEKAQHPVVGISWYEAMAYAQWANKRLPTSIEWKRAAQGGEKKPYPWGEEFDLQRCNTLESHNNTTTPVKQYETGISVYGVFDMAGNVWEWTLDEIKPRGLGRKDQEMKRILKGGSWKTFKGAAECTAQTSAWPNERFDDAGFRCVQSVN